MYVYALIFAATMANEILMSWFMISTVKARVWRAMQVGIALELSRVPAIVYIAGATPESHEQFVRIFFVILGSAAGIYTTHEILKLSK